MAEIKIEVVISGGFLLIARGYPTPDSSFSDFYDFHPFLYFCKFLKFNKNGKVDLKRTIRNNSSEAQLGVRDRTFTKERNEG